MYYWHWLGRVVRRPWTGGYPTEPDPEGARQAHADAVAVCSRPPARELPLRRSLALRHLDAGSCNGCESELAMLISPEWDFSRYGFTYTPSPRHADALVVTGVVTPELAKVLQGVYADMPEPKWVLAVGDCALGRGPLAEDPDDRPLRGTVPVRAVVGGCPPTPADILRALLLAVETDEPREAKVAGGDG